MVRTITPLSKIPKLEIFFGENKSPFGTGKNRSDFVSEYVPIKAPGELILRVEDATAYGFRKETTKKGAVRYSLPLNVSDEFAEALDKIARKLGEEDYSPVYHSEEGARAYARVIMSNGGIIFSNIYDGEGKTVKPQVKTGSVPKVEAAIQVDCVRFGDNPKIQLSLIEARVEDTELVREKLL